MAVRGPDRERLQDEQVERALEHFSLYGLATSFWHSLHKIIYLRDLCPAPGRRVLAISLRGSAVRCYNSCRERRFRRFASVRRGSLMAAVQGTIKRLVGDK